MIRIANPVIQTKFLDTSLVRSTFLWWSNTGVYADKHKAFLQFETWSMDRQGANTTFTTIWKYPCFHTAFNDMTYIVKQVPRIQPCIVRYAVEPSVQVIGDAPPSASAALTALNGLLPKKPL